MPSLITFDSKKINIIFIIWALALEMHTPKIVKRKLFLYFDDMYQNLKSGWDQIVWFKQSLNKYPEVLFYVL